MAKLKIIKHADGTFDISVDDSSDNNNEDEVIPTYNKVFDLSRLNIKGLQDSADKIIANSILSMDDNQAQHLKDKIDDHFVAVFTECVLLHKDGMTQAKNALDLGLYTQAQKTLEMLFKNSLLEAIGKCYGDSKDE